MNGSQGDDLSLGYQSGAAYVFTRSGGTWSQQAYVKASNTDLWDQFGRALALSGDGSTLVVGAHYESSSSVFVNGNQANNNANISGAVYAFTRSGSAWSQQAYIKASDTAAGNQFGWCVGLSADGNTLGVGALGTDINGLLNAGAGHVYLRVDGAWLHHMRLLASTRDTGDAFGGSIAVSGNGNTVAVGAYAEASNATGVNGNQADNSASLSGAMYTFSLSGGAWGQQGYIKASNTGADDRFGIAVALSSTGDTLAVAGPREDSNAVGIGGNQTNNLATESGALYVFAR